MIDFKTYSDNLKTECMHKKRIISDVILVPKSIAVDMDAQNLFWIDSSENGKGTLEVMSLRSR